MLMSSSISRVTRLPRSPNVGMQSEIAQKSNSVRLHPDMSRSGRTGSRSRRVEPYGSRCYFTRHFRNVDTFRNDAFKRHISKELFGGVKIKTCFLSVEPIGKQHIHRVRCRVSVPANGTPLCRLSRQVSFIVL